MGGRGKGTLYELGFRTPLVFNWPGRVPSAVVRDDLVSALDVMPTILEYAGAEPVPDRDGRSLAAGITSGASVGQEKIVTRYEGTLAQNRGFVVRTPQWRYIASEDGREQLYAIADDPLEELDLAALHAELLPGFRDDVVAWQAALGSPAARLDVTGVLQDGGAAPIAGAELQLRGRSADAGGLRLRVLSGPDGAFRFAGLPHGTYELRAGRRVRQVVHGRYASRIPARLPVGTLGAHLTLVGARAGGLDAANDGAIRGFLRADDGTPLGRVTITLRGRGGGAPISATVLAGPDGRYRFENLPPGSYRLSARPGRGFARAARAVVLAAGTEADAELVANRR